MSSSVEQIKERLSIEEVVGSYVKLERAGASFKARCPFHNEKTPSFFVSPERQSYYCFGCGAKGDIFTFVEQFENVEFIDALKLLAERAGVTLEKFAAPAGTDKKARLYELLEACTKFLEKNLSQEELPLEYLHKRGLTDKTIAEWRIGFVRDEWRSIRDYLGSKGFTDEEMSRAGMIKTENDSTYDRFRGRIMFPIFDGSGRVIAYSGRILHDDGKSAKYLNSPQTELFDKSKVLYGYNKAKQSIRKADYSILVEGQMDLLMSHQAGFSNVVASSGTALTPDHLALLKRISNRVIMSFDADNAGAKAAERAWAIALEAGMDVKIAAMPKGFDPADLILKDKEAFKEVLKNAIHLVDFMLNRAEAETQDKKKLWDTVRVHILPYVYRIESMTERGRYVSKISRMIDVKEDFIWDDLKKIKIETSSETPATHSTAVDRAVSEEILKKGSIERSLASILVHGEKNSSELLANEHVAETAENIFGNRFAQFKEEMTRLGDELYFEAEAYYSGFDEPKMRHEIRYLLLCLREEYFKAELKTLLTELKTAESNKEQVHIDSVSLRLKEIMEKLNKIKGEKSTLA